MIYELKNWFLQPKSFANRTTYMCRKKLLNPLNAVVCLSIAVSFFTNAVDHRIGQHETVLPIPGSLDVTHEIFASGCLVSEMRKSLWDFMNVVFETIFAGYGPRRWIVKEPAHFFVADVVVPFRKLAFQAWLGSHPKLHSIYVGQGVHPAWQVLHVNTRGGMGA